MEWPLAYEELVGCLQAIITHSSSNPSQLRRHGFYDGPSSISLLFYRLSCYYPSMILEDRSLIDWARHYFCPFPDNQQLPSITRCGITSEVPSLMVLSIILNPTSASANIHSLCARATELASGKDDPSYDWQDGLAGMLYFLRLAHCVRWTRWAADRTAATELTVAADLECLTNATRAIIQRILSDQRPWRCNGKSYLGAAHGVIGILTQITLSVVGCLTSFDAMQFTSIIERRLEEAISLQFLSGNFPSETIEKCLASSSRRHLERHPRRWPKSDTTSPPEPISEPSHLGKDRKVGFCHGAPGILISLNSMQRCFPTLWNYINWVKTLGENCIRSRGVSKYESCLCHGIAGNAMPLSDFDEALAILEQHGTWGAIDAGLQSGEVVHSTHPWGLLRGEAGRAWSWAVMHRELPGTILGYNDF